MLLNEDSLTKLERSCENRNEACWKSITHKLQLLFYVMKFNRKFAWSTLVHAQAFNTPLPELRGFVLLALYLLYTSKFSISFVFPTRFIMDLWYGKLQSQEDKRKILFFHLGCDPSNPFSLPDRICFKQIMPYKRANKTLWNILSWRVWQNCFTEFVVCFLRGFCEGVSIVNEFSSSW